jgi:hypothetical protein
MVTTNPSLADWALLPHPAMVRPSAETVVAFRSVQSDGTSTPLRARYVESNSMPKLGVQTDAA